MRFSALGAHGAGWCAVAAAGAVGHRSRRPDYLKALGATMGAYFANQLIKVAVRRRRPRLHGLPPLTGTVSNLSYPSAHAATSFAAAGALPLPGPPLYALAGGMALSRAYLGVHYPTDVLAGAVLGHAVARLVP